MKQAILNRRDFLKTTVAGTALAVSPAVNSRAEETKTSNPAKKSKKVKKNKTPEGTIVRSDMSQCTPQNARSRKIEKDQWQLIDYETKDGIKGMMISAQPEDRCGELTLPLNAQGLHKIFLGVNYTRSKNFPHSNYGAVEVKLTGDAGFRRVAMELNIPKSDKEYYKTIHESFWKIADLTDKSLIIRQQQYPYNRFNRQEENIIQKDRGDISNISYVKMVPLSEEEKRQWQQAQPREDTRKLMAFFCTGQFTGHIGGTYTFHPNSKEFIKDEFEAYANSDFKILSFEALRGYCCVYNTKIGDMGTKDNRWQDNWVDPLAEFTKLAHENGMKIFAGLRFIGAQFPMNRQPIARATYYWKHQEWAKLNEEGVPISNLSLAFPEVRNYWLSLLRETLDYGIDGINLYLHRSSPFVGYEEPVVSSFLKKYGEDPRKLSEKDPRWLTHTAEYITQFIREIRALVDEKPGRELCVTVGFQNRSYASYLTINCDVETWLREDLVNYVVVTHAVNLPLLKEWQKIAQKGVQIWTVIALGDLRGSSGLLPDDAGYDEAAKMYFEAGVDGFGVWDAERKHSAISQWAKHQRLGHKELLDQLIQYEKDEDTNYYRRRYLKYLNGLSVEGSFSDG